MDLLTFFKIIHVLFKTLPEEKQNKIVDTIIEKFHSVFTRKKNTKETMQEATEIITPTQWNTTSIEIGNLLPQYLKFSKKKKFTESVIDLVQSESFLEELNARTNEVKTDDENLYIEQCSQEMRKLIFEMLKDKK
ncbi:hypothetical protein ACQV2E_08610 [Pantoea allii]|uniref:hypothetical protein n=1 Tax=Pantoea allii TaxID=574096 RepID=UPI0024B71C25|nr:hypothetical protein [Pantoea allii]MDJ0090901.1 hypothetical protein [Pantoea allii]